MNDMELLRELAQETPLPGPAELDAARAGLVAAIATDPATYATAVAQVTTDQPYPSTGQPTEPLRPPAPAPVLTAGKPLPVQRPAGRAADPALFPEYLAIPQDNAGLRCRLPGRGYRTSSKAPRTIASNPDRADGDGAAAGSLSIATTTKVWPLLLVAR
jgi:hypothetical protein